MAKSKSKRFLRSHLNFTRWMGVEELKQNAKSLKGLVRAMVTVKEPERSETYEEAVSRMELSPEHIEKRKQHFFRMALIYMILAICIAIYSIHFLWHNHGLASFMCLPLLSVLLSFAFREHFWYTQMKYKRLGFTFREWFLTLFGRG